MAVNPVVPIQTATAAGIGTVTAVFGSPPASGNAICITAANLTNNTTASVTVGGRNATAIHTQALSGVQTISQLVLVAWAAQSASVVAAVTGASLVLNIAEVSGTYAGIAGILDATGVVAHTGSVTSSQLYAASVTTTQTGDYVWTSILTGSPVTNLAVSAGSLVQPASSTVADAWQADSSTGPIAPYWTWTTSSSFVQITSALKASVTNPGMLVLL